MEGWTEEEIQNKELRAPCGIFFGACAIYIASRDHDNKFKELIAAVWGVTPQEVECYGCMQTDPPKKRFGHCEKCEIRNCATSKTFYSCHQCEEWVCQFFKNMELAPSVPSSIKESVQRVMLRSIPVWREKVSEYGDEKGSLEWARAECERYHCPECGEPLYRSAQHCRLCKTPVGEKLDGVI